MSLKRRNRMFFKKIKGVLVMEAYEFLKIFLICKYSFIISGLFFFFWLNTRRRGQIEGLYWMISFSSSVVAFVFSTHAKMLAIERMRESLTPQAQMAGDFFNFFLYFFFIGSTIIMFFLFIVAIIRERRRREIIRPE